MGKEAEEEEKDGVEDGDEGSGGDATGHENDEVVEERK